MRRIPEKAESIKPGYLSLANFKKFVDLNPEISNIELSNTGEIFLNPDLLAILQYAHSKGVGLSAYNGTNLNDVSDEVLEALVSTNFGMLVVALDGASQESYVQYRYNGSFDKVIENIKKINAYKKKHHSDSPYLRWKYIIFESNDKREEIHQAKAMAKELNMDLAFYKDYMGYTPSDTKMIEEETGLVYDQEKFVQIKEFNRDAYFPCFSLWHEPQVNWDGRFLGCCSNHYQGFGGNLFETSLRDYLKTPAVEKTKKMLQGGEKFTGTICHQCYFYLQMVEHQNFIRDEELEKFAEVFG